VIFARINLSQTDYTTTLVDWAYIRNPDIDQLNDIYRSYCQYKKFTSVMPIFASEYTDRKNDVIGYYVDNHLVAFSLIRRFDQHNAEAVQFAWNYADPKRRLGILSLQTECAIYKSLGYHYLYLDQADDYKRAIDGFEILGPLE
jgi:hypothetical protein